MLRRRTVPTAWQAVVALLEAARQNGPDDRGVQVLLIAALVPDEWWPMTNREFHLQCRKNETLAFLRVLNALPHDKFDYRPHEKSQPVSAIVWTLISEAQACLRLIETGEITFSAPPALPAADMLDAFEQAWEALLHKVESMDEATWNKTGRFMLNGEVRMEQPVSGFLWLFFFDAIHHRGQLSTYIRPMGGRVPSIYGPSGTIRRCSRWRTSGSPDPVRGRVVRRPNPTRLRPHTPPSRWTTDCYSDRCKSWDLLTSLNCNEPERAPPFTPTELANADASS